MDDITGKIIGVAIEVHGYLVRGCWNPFMKKHCATNSNCAA